MKGEDVLVRGKL